MKARERRIYNLIHSKPLTLATKWDDVELTCRTARLLSDAGIVTVGEVLTKSAADLRALGFSRYTLRELTICLAADGLTLAAELEPRRVRRVTFTEDELRRFVADVVRQTLAALPD